MQKLLIFVLVLAVAIGGLGYWRGWFSVSRAGAQVDAEKFKQDKADFSKTVREKAKAMKEQVATLGKKSEGLTGGDKVHAQKELGELNEKHDRLEQQIKELEATGQDKFESIKEDLSKNLKEVEKKIEELTKKLDKGTDK
jgi:chromosome segregation ATPase